MNRKVALLIDGGHLSVLAKKDGHRCDAPFIERMAKNCIDPDEELFRVLYYDCAQYTGSQKLPVSGRLHEFKGGDGLLQDLERRDLFAVRRGILKFRGWEPKSVPFGKIPGDEDFRPRFEQKGVDMRIGLDIASLSATRVVERIILVTGDTDFVPALKHARRAGLQAVLIEVPGHKLSYELLCHSDFKRPRTWPSAANNAQKSP